MTEKRNYRLRKRAETKEETRQRIVEASMQLHEELGPSLTTISAIAERAGVQRLTVYRHFADETAIFQACTSHWLCLNPLPDPDKWMSISDGMERTRTALLAFYHYYRQTERMLTVSYRDEALVPALQQPMEEVRTFMRSIKDGLMAALDNNPELAITVQHALDFTTWKSLREQGLSDEKMVTLVCGWISASGRL
ncbi:TetR/AcrR family transcriptional regulator [Nitrincola alkalilacustris]|uniref:TetR/AcrR family transcriptional regulator n=1 Tax=Nitrincola alkalilacustris TaxID=1571224 RepID=UPI00124F24CB|nr:TetR/AcrR family transcriptional regulator [Nitrincola alkalilacustris]